MYATRRSVFAFILALLGAVVLGAASMLSPPATMAATTALIVPGTSYPDPDVVTNYKPNARDYYIAPFNPSCDSTCNLVGVPYIAQFAPLGLVFPGWGGLNGVTWDVSVASGVTSLESKLAAVPAGENVVIFGYSQGAAVVSIEKGKLADAPNKDQMSIVLIGNIDRPSGGLFTRLGFLGHVPILNATTGEPTPTDTGIPTTDIALEYDGVSDFPLYLTNGLAVLNALAGLNYIHGNYLNPTSREPGPLPYGYTPETLQAAMNDPANQQTFGDTTYVTIPATSLPIVQPFLDLAASTGTTAVVEPIVDLVSPTLRVLIDLGYDRSINPGVPTTARLIAPINPVTLTQDLVAATVEGVQAVVGDLGGATTTAPTNPAPSTTNVSPLAAARVVDTSTLSTLANRSGSQPETTEAKTDPPTDNNADESKATVDTELSAATGQKTTPSTKASTTVAKPERPKPLRNVVRELQKTTERIVSALKGEKPSAAGAGTNEAGTSAQVGDGSSTDNGSSTDSDPAKDAKDAKDAA